MAIRLKTIVVVLLLGLSFGSLYSYRQTIFQEGNPVPIALGIFKVSITPEKYASIGQDKYLIEASDAAKQQLLHHLNSKDIEFQEQMGSGLFFEDINGHRIYAHSRMLTTSFQVWEFKPSD